MLAHYGGSASAVRAHEELFAYWSSRRDNGRLPGRAHIDPRDFKRHLPTISLIDVGREEPFHGEAQPANFQPANFQLASFQPDGPRLEGVPLNGVPLNGAPLNGAPLNGARRDPADYRLRLAGTGLYGVYGREITGLKLGDVYDPDSTVYWRAQLDKIVRDRKPGVGFHSMAWRGASHLSLLWLRLPLARDGRNVDMILGYDVLVGVGAEERQTGIRAA